MENFFGLPVDGQIGSDNLWTRLGNIHWHTCEKEQEIDNAKVIGEASDSEADEEEEEKDPVVVQPKKKNKRKKKWHAKYLSRFNNKHGHGGAGGGAGGMGGMGGAGGMGGGEGISA